MPQESEAPAPAVPAVIERELEYWPAGAPDSIPIRVRIGIPIQDVECTYGLAWSCRLTIEGFGRPYSMAIPQVDAIAALLAALSLAPHVLDAHARPGRLTWLGSEDLGFATGASERAASSADPDEGENGKRGTDSGATISGQ